MNDSNTTTTSEGDATMLAAVNGAVTAVADATVPATDLGLLRGDGAFEVFQLYRGIPFALDDHIARLERSAAAIDLEVDRGALERDIAGLLAAIPPDDGNVRVIVTRNGTRVLLQEPVVQVPERLRLALVPHLVTPLLAGVKSLSYVLNCHARRIAQAEGCDDALLFDAADGQILEGPFTSFAWVQDGRLCTPPLSARILDSITRRVLLEAVEVEERRCTRADLERADGACVMGTGIEIVPVAEIKDVCAFGETADAVRSAATAVSELIQSRLHADVSTCS